MARDNEEKGERKCRRNKGIKITDSQKDCAAITNTHAHTYTGTFERQKGQHHWHHVLRNLCYCHTTSYAYVCVCGGIEHFLLTLNPCRIQFPPSHFGCPFRNRYLVFKINSNCCIKYGTALHFNWIHTLSTHTLPIVMVCICVRGGGRGRDRARTPRYTLACINYLIADNCRPSILSTSHRKIVNARKKSSDTSTFPA